MRPRSMCNTVAKAMLAKLFQKHVRRSDTLLSFKTFPNDARIMEGLRLRLRRRQNTSSSQPLVNLAEDLLAVVRRGVGTGRHPCRDRKVPRRSRGNAQRYWDLK